MNAVSGLARRPRGKPDEAFLKGLATRRVSGTDLYVQARGRRSWPWAEDARERERNGGECIRVIIQPVCKSHR